MSNNYGLTEEQVIELIRRHTEKSVRDRSAEYVLPEEIHQDLEETTSKERKANIKRYVNDALHYDGGNWTRSGAVNKVFVQELRNTKVEALQAIQQKFKDADRIRIAARGATEIYEELQFILTREGGEDDGERLSDLVEKVRRLAVYGYATGKAMDNEAKELTTKVLNLPQAVLYIGDEDEEGKDMVFDQSVVEQIHRARYEDAILKNATSRS